MVFIVGVEGVELGPKLSECQGGTVDGRVAVQMQHGSLEITHSTTHSIMADVPFYIILSEYVMMGETGPFVDGVTDADAVPAHWVDIGCVDGSLASPEAQEKDKNATFDVCKRLVLLEDDDGVAK